METIVYDLKILNQGAGEKVQVEIGGAAGEGEQPFWRVPAHCGNHDGNQSCSPTKRAKRCKQRVSLRGSETTLS